MVQVLPTLDDNKHVVHSQTDHEQGKDVMDWPVEETHGRAQPKGHDHRQVSGQHP